MRYSSRFFLYAPFLMFVSLAAGVMIYWWFAATALNKQLDAWNGHEVLPGVKVSFTGKKIAGFPFRLDAILDRVKVEVATSNGPLVWRTEHFASHMLTYGPVQAIYEAAGQQEITWRDSDGLAHEFDFVPGTMRASSIAAHGALTRFDLDIVEISSPDLGAGRAQFHMRKNPSADVLDVVLKGETIKLAPQLRAGFGDTISHLELDARLLPGSAYAPLLGGRADWRQATDAWRMRGGKFAVDKLAIAWGGLQTTSRGRLALDGDHKLDGTLALDVNGPLAPAATNDARLAAALFIVASQMNATASGKLSVPIVFKNGNVLASGTPAGRIGPLY